MATSSCLLTNYCAAQVPQRAGEQELTRVAFKGGKGTYQLADGTVHTGRLQLKTSSSVTIQAQGQLDGVEFKPSDLQQFTIGTDSFVVVRDFWVPRYKGSGFSRKFDPLDTAHVSIAFAQKHINRGGLELLRYVDVRIFEGYLMGTSGSPGSTYAANDFYCYYLFRRRSAAPVTYRAVPGEAASIRKSFGPLIADVPTVHDYLLSTTFAELKLPRIFSLYLYSKGY
jgi:hypothetical protein